MIFYDKLKFALKYLELILKKISNNSNIIQVTLSFVMTVATVSLTIFNYQYIKLTKYQLNEIEKQRKFSEIQLIINNTSQLTILTPEKNQTNDKLFFKCLLQNDNGVAKNVEIEVFLIKTDSKFKQLFQHHSEKTYVNNIQSGKIQYVSMYAPDELKWIKESMALEKNRSLKLTVIVKYVQSPVLPGDNNQTQFDSASFFWDKNRDQWGNISGIEHSDLVHLLKENGLCPEYPLI
jgi:hypothetical protein